MNEVGFRNTIAAVSSSASAPQDKNTESAPAKPPTKAPRVAPRGSRPEIPQRNSSPPSSSTDPPTGDLIQFDDVDSTSVANTRQSFDPRIMQELQQVFVPSRKPPTVPFKPPEPPKRPGIPDSTGSSSLNKPQLAASTDESGNEQTQSENSYAVIQKPKRPTIIRPGKPETIQNTENKEQVFSHMPSNGTPTLPPRLYDENSKDASDNLPEFLKKKLKSTVVNDSERTTEENKDQGSIGPPPATKPKPSVRPKPPTPNKPSVSSKPTIIKPSLPVKSQSSDDVTVPETLKQTADDTADKLDQTEILKPISTKRPTIIRPSKPAGSGSMENIPTSENSQADLRVKDDCDLHRPKAFPSQRPVTMFNFSNTAEQDLMNKGSHLNTKTDFGENGSSQEDVSISRPKPLPRPAARSRPASMMVQSVSKPVSGTSSSQDDAGLPAKHSSPPLRPAAKPSRPSLPAMAQEPQNTNHPPSGEATHAEKSVRKFGVSVLPQPSAPPKPPSPRKTETQTAGKPESSSSDEEFVDAQDKPDRPSGESWLTHFH